MCRYGIEYTHTQYNIGRSRALQNREQRSHNLPVRFSVRFFCAVLLFFAPLRVHFESPSRVAVRRACASQSVYVSRGTSVWAVENHFV